MANTFLLDLYISVLDINVQSSGVYSVVMDENDNALRLITGVYSLQAFLIGNQNAAAIPLTQHPNRTKYWSATLQVSAMNLPDNLPGQSYVMEFWEHAGAGNYDRTIDDLIAVKPFKWKNNTLAEFATTEDVDHWFAQLSASYDSSTNTATFTAWLEYNGQLITTATRCEVYWYDRTNTVILHAVSTTPQISGQFYFSQASLLLQADIATFAKVAITDASGVVHTSGLAFNTWD